MGLEARVAERLELGERKVRAALRLFDDGNTVPFVARYRKEATGGLDEVQLRAIQSEHKSLQALEERRAAVLASIEEQGKLTSGLRAAIEGAQSRAVLEDLYLPYKRKRRTRAAQARERGLGPLAARIVAQPDGDPLREAARYVDASAGVEDAEAALAGARDIVAEEVCEEVEVRGWARDQMQRDGWVESKRIKSKAKEQDDADTFRAYFDYRESVRRIPTHRWLAVLRGEARKVLRVKLCLDQERLQARILGRRRVRRGSGWAAQLEAAVADGVKRLLVPSVETEVRAALKDEADQEAVGVFAENVRHKLLAAPFGTKSVVAIDPGLRTGCKCAALDAQGTYRGTVTVYPHGSASQRAEAARQLRAFVEQHTPAAIAVGNGTAGRETEAFVRETLDGAQVVSVDEAGASVYSASEVAREEFPELDVTVRGAISIGRRLQDPLAELVKVDPKSIGVGQYQHDVHQGSLAEALDEVVEDCVNQVGVELNTASASLLRRVAGIGPKLAKSIVAHREARGAFGGREALQAVSGLGPKTYEQAAGFLRVRGGAHPLDASGVHPERYGLVERIARDVGVEVGALVGDARAVGEIELGRYVSEEVGEPTLRDILAELEKPGRDPRAAFQAVAFRDDVRTVEDLRPGLTLQGVVTNVTHFGAFVDVGVHQDGLVHISQLADRFVRDPHEEVRVGERVTVRVLEVDAKRKRISLSRRSERS